MTYKASYVSINDEGSESKCTRIVNKSWKRISCDVPGYCSSTQQTPAHMFETLLGLYGEPSFCSHSDPDNGVVGFAEWNFPTKSSSEGPRVNQIVVRDEFVYNDLPSKHVDLITSRLKIDIYDHAAKAMLSTMSDGVRVDPLQYQLYVRADDLDRTNAIISAALQANAPNREYVDKPADLFEHLVAQEPSACYLPDDTNGHTVCKKRQQGRDSNNKGSGEKTVQTFRVADSPTMDLDYDKQAIQAEKATGGK